MIKAVYVCFIHSIFFSKILVYFLHLTLFELLLSTPNSEYTTAPLAAEELDCEEGEEVPVTHSPKTPVFLPSAHSAIHHHPSSSSSSMEHKAMTPFPPSRRTSSSSDAEDEEAFRQATAAAGGVEENGGEEETAYRRQQLFAAAANDSNDDDDELDGGGEEAPVRSRSKSPPQKEFFGTETTEEEDITLTAATAAPPANDATFRRRRLTFATQGNIPPHTPLSQIQQRVFRSLEIGDVPKVPLPFREGQVGTYSCHGIEPSYLDTRPFIAKINQDRGVCVYPFAGHERMALFCVFDGHGEQGDKVSEFCMYELPRTLEAHPCLLEGEGDVTKAFKETFLGVDEKLARKAGIDAFYSGTTAVVCLVKEGRLWVANAGDSRCTLATVDPDWSGRLLAQDLSIDQNPDSPMEMARIVGRGGFVSPPPEPGLSARVWLDADFTQVGLAMARSIGDYAVKGVGVIAEPEVMMHELREGGRDRFLLSASDGVWEFISSQEAVDIVWEELQKGVGVSGACQVLIEQAAARWRDVEGDYRDDITALLIMLPIFK